MLALAGVVVPVLLVRLMMDYDGKNKEGIIRALTVKEAIWKAGSVLISEYNRTLEDKMSLRWARLSTQNAQQGVGMQSIWGLYEYLALLKYLNITGIKFHY